MDGYIFEDRLPVGLYSLIRFEPRQISFTYANDRLLEMLQLRREDVLSDPATMFDRVHPEDLPAMMALSEDSALTLRPFRWEGRMMVGSAVKWVTIEANPRPIGDGKIGYDGVVVDITGPKELARRLTAVLEAARANTWRRDLRTGWSEFGGHWTTFVEPQHLNGISHEDWLRLVHPDDVAPILADVAALELGTLDNAVWTYRRRVNGREWRWLRVHAGVSERDAEGRATALSGVSFDITDEMEERARAAEDRARLRTIEQSLADARAELERTAFDLTENIPIGTYTMVLKPGDSLAHFAFMSSRFLEITGLSRREAQENPLNAFRCVHPEDFDDWVRANERAFVNKEPFREETRLLIDGKLSWVMAESIPRALEDGTWIWEGVIHDITAQKQAEQALRETTGQLIETARERARIEERQRMLQDLHDGFGNQLAIGKLRLRRGAGSAAEAERVLEDCLDDLKLLFDSLDADEGDGLLAVLVNLKERMEKRTRTLPVKLFWDIATAADVQLEPRAMLQAARIVQEALANALRHGEARRISIACHNENGAPCLVIEDDGIGFDADRPPTGRGLANMRRRAAQEGWTLDICSDSVSTGVRLCFG